MTAQSPAAKTAPRSVRVIYLARSLAFAYAGGVLALLAWQRELGAAVWVGQLVLILSLTGSLGYAWMICYFVFFNSRLLARTQQDLRRSETRYRLITENVGDLVALLDAEGRWVYFSPSHAQYLDEQALRVGHDSIACLAPEDRPRLAAALQEAMAHGTPFEMRLHLVAKEGGQRLLKSIGRAVAGHDGLPAHVVLVSRDISELRDQQARLEVAAHAFDEMTEAIMICSAEGTVVTVNEAFCRITGLEEQAIIGASEHVTRLACQPDSFYDNLYATVEREGRWTGTTWSRRRDGSLYREWRNVSAIRDEAGRITYFVTLFFELDSRDAHTAPPVAHLALRRR
jgi:PAS domain S-box-containing protein